FWAALSADEQQRAEQFKSLTVKNYFIFGRGALRYLLSNYLQLPAEQLSFVYNPHGKPLLSSSLIQFNISHSNNMILFAITLRSTIGVDIEFLDRELKNYLALAKRFFTDNEYQRLKLLPEAVQLENFFRYWTRKEAICKAMGAGIFDC